MRIFSYLQRVVAVEQSKYLNIVYDNDDNVVVWLSIAPTERLRLSSSKGESSAAKTGRKEKLKLR